jgi:hypothetical protein
MRCIKALFLAGLLLLPSWAFAEGVLKPPANPPDRVLYDYRSNRRLQDDFVHGTSTGTIGNLGWTAAGGTVTQSAGATNRMGLVLRDTSGSSGTVAYTELNGATQSFMDPSALHNVLWIVKLTQTDANTTVWYGAAASAQVSVPNDGIYIEKRDADTNWFCVTRAASSQAGSRINSTVAVSTADYTKFYYERLSGGVQFYINNVPVCGLMTTNIPTLFLNPGALIVNSAAASKTHTIDYFELNITGLTR